MVLEVMTNAILNFAESQYGPVVKLILVTIPVVIYAVFIFYFYRFLAKKNIIELNLSQYNKYSEGPLLRIIPIILYILEYIIILPIITFFWFATLSILVFFLAAELQLETVLLISASLIAAVRVTSYVSEHLSQDLAKMLPLTLLGIALTNPLFFSFSEHVERFGELPIVINEVAYFLVFIIVIELIMRLFDLLTRIAYERRSMQNKEEEILEEEATA